jgi:hypothetical protein
MKNLIFVFLFFFTINSWGSNKKKELNIISYDVDIKLDTTLQKIDVSTTISIENSDTTRFVKFLFSDWIKINKMTLNKSRLEYSQKKDTLLVRIGDKRTIKLFLNYSLPIFKFKHDKIISLKRELKWCPFIYDDLSVISSRISLPKGWTVYSSGSLKNYSKNDTISVYKFQNKINSGFPIIIAPVGYYKEVNVTQNKYNIKYCFHNNDSLLTRSIINETHKGLEFSTEYIGKNKCHYLTYIETPAMDGAQSLETFVLMGTNFIRYFGLYPDIRFWPSHETIHQWVGAGYFNSISKNSRNRWFIEESLTEYLRYIYVKEKYGCDSLNTEIRKSINYYNTNIKGTKEDVTISANLPNDITYCIGPLILHTVRLEMGDEHWHKFIRKLYADNYGKVIDYDVFKKTLSLYANQSIIQKMEDSMNRKGIPQEYSNY